MNKSQSTLTGPAGHLSPREVPDFSLMHIHTQIGAREGVFKSSPPRARRLQIPLRLGIPRLIGITFFIGGLFRFRSVGPVVFGIWSRTVFVFFACVACVWLVEIVRLLRRLLDVPSHSLLKRSRSMQFLDMAALAWGAAYFLDAGAGWQNGAKIAELVFFGSVAPIATSLQWLTMVLLFLAAATFVAPRAKGRLAQISLTIGTLLVLFLVGEGVCRIQALAFPMLDYFPTYSTAVWNHRYVSLNSEGWRDVEHRIVAPAGEQRFLVVGDSFAFGLGIPNIKDRMGERLVPQIERMTGQRWKSINVSFGGGDTLDEIRLLHKALIYKPNLVLLIYVFNDMDYLLPKQPQQETIFQRDDEFDPFMVLFRNSFLFQQLYMDWKLLYWRIASPDFGQEYQNPRLLARHMLDVRRFVQIATQAGAKALVIPFSIRITASAAWRTRYALFLKQARADGIPVCSLANAFNGYDYGQLDVSEFDGHPNALANALATKVVAGCLRTGIAK